MLNKPPKKISRSHLFFPFSYHSFILKLQFTIYYVPVAASCNKGQDRHSPCPPGAYNTVTYTTQVAFLQLPLLRQRFPLWTLAHPVSLLPTPPAEIKPNSNATSSRTPSLAFPTTVSFLLLGFCDQYRVFTYLTGSCVELL